MIDVGTLKPYRYLIRYNVTTIVCIALAEPVISVGSRNKSAHNTKPTDCNS